MTEQQPDMSRGRRALREARDAIRPKPGFETRLLRALAEAELEKLASARRRSRARWVQLSLSLPATLGVVWAAYVTCVEQPFDTMSVAEHQLEVPLGGEASLSVDLALHHHGSEWADVSVSAPRHLGISTHDVGAVTPLSCRGNRCRYDIGRGAAHSPRPVQMRLSQPGRYRVEIEHHSSRASVREVLVIHARR